MLPALYSLPLLSTSQPFHFYSCPKCFRAGRIVTVNTHLVLSNYQRGRVGENWSAGTRYSKQSLPVPCVLSNYEAQEIAGFCMSNKKTENRWNQKRVCKETLTFIFTNALQLHLISAFHFIFNLFSKTVLDKVDPFSMCRVTSSQEAVFQRKKKHIRHFPCRFLCSYLLHSIVFNPSLCLCFSLSCQPLCHCIVFAILDLYSDVQCPWVLRRNRYINSV